MSHRTSVQQVDTKKKLKLMIHMLRWHWFYFPHTTFNLSSWSEGVTKETSCGTTACAVGSAMYFKPFVKLGLTPVYRPWAARSLPTFNGSNGWYAVEDFFNLTFHEARYLFSSTHNYKTRKDVIKRIKLFLRSEL